MAGWNQAGQSHGNCGNPVGQRVEFDSECEQKATKATKELPIFVSLVCFCSKEVLMGDKIGLAPIRKSQSDRLRQRSRCRAALRVLKVKSYGLTPRMTPRTRTQKLFAIFYRLRFVTQLSSPLGPKPSFV